MKNRAQRFTAILPLIFCSIVFGQTPSYEQAPTVEERGDVSDIRFQGNKVFSSQLLASKMREILSSHRREDDENYDAEVLDISTRQLTNFVRSQGYLQARAGALKKEITSQGLVLTIPFEEGPLYRLGEVEIKGAEHIAPEQLRAMLNLQQGSIANGELIGKWLFEDLKKVYGSMGFIEYTAEPVPAFKTIAEGKSEGVVDFTVFIEEGHQFRIRSIKFLGSTLSKAALPGILLLREGDIYDEQLFEKSISKLNEMGLFQEIDKDKDASFRTDSESAVLDIVIKVNDRRFETEAGEPPPQRVNQKP